MGTDGRSRPASQTHNGARTVSSCEIRAASTAGMSRAPSDRKNRARPIWTTPIRARKPRFVPPISVTWANGAKTANTRTCDRHVAGAIDTSALRRVTTIVAAKPIIARKEKVMPARLGRDGAPAITAKPPAATPIAAQVLRRTGSPASRPSSAAVSGTSAWMTMTSATGASLSAVMNDPEETVISTATASPGRPMARKARTTRPRSATATRTNTAMEEKTARPASCEARLMCSWSCRIPARDHAVAASAQ